jgi:hypothetical protein
VTGPSRFEPTRKECEIILCDVSQSGDGDARRITIRAKLSWFRFVDGGAALRSARPGR